MESWPVLLIFFLDLFILDPVGPMIQRHLQEKVHAFVTTSSSSRSLVSHNIAWHIVHQSLHEGQPDQLTRGPHSQLEERRLNTNKPHSYATTTRQTTYGRPMTDNVQITHSAKQSDSNIASEGAPDYRTPFNWTHTCYAIQLQISSLTRHSGERACCRPRPGRSCSPKRN